MFIGKEGKSKHMSIETFPYPTGRFVKNSEEMCVKLVKCVQISMTTNGYQIQKRIPIMDTSFSRISLTITPNPLSLLSIYSFVKNSKKI